MYLLIVFLPLLGSSVAGFFGRFLGSEGTAIMTTTCVSFSSILSLIAFYEVALGASACYLRIAPWISSEMFDASWGFFGDREAVDSFIREGKKGPKHGRCRTLEWQRKARPLFPGLFGHTVPAEDQVGEPCDGKPSRTVRRALKTNERFTTTSLHARGARSIRRLADKAAIKAMLVNRIGLHTWLPDAMEGPTPVSALIHAATMVTAGVFMIARCSPLFEYSPTALVVITFAGAMTSFLAATTGILQNDLKRVIAYSTCSQLGYMIFACGISNYSVSVFHLMNHAFFKALLFLSAGSVIHAMSDEQDMRKMGGLASSFPFTYAMMLMGSLSLIGFPFLTGFYSKDVILELAYTKYTISGNFAFWSGQRKPSFLEEEVKASSEAKFC
ncbi:hypothetical protein RHSIM_RhsimMtG0004100 (mitochondrion) [Rhododendron simsii]|uniref:NADH:quinone oxidoreductase/Mrp antiporter transmembrane domain-containing protein n=1 Tax=Rhododendron simsii TaxID=118357 RepID=A0A834FXD6_RHOSS|nr:hypothetical protein RHSIM_RhsimMtG0004100 [Rhododendron simsii]